jgi:competence protein ComEC
MSAPIGICYHFDVGQGSANLIRIGEHLVVIDCGFTGEEILEYLHDRNIEKVDVVVLSHNDADHAKGLIYLLNEYEGRIEHLWYQNDLLSLGPDPSGLARKRLLSTIAETEQAKKIGAVHYLYQTQEYISLMIWKVGEAQLELLYPLPKDNLKALLRHDPNLSCGVLRFTCGIGSIIFAADAPMEAWRLIEERFGKLNCDILTVPHHGGHVHQNANAVALSQRTLDLNALYSSIICSKFAVVSVGTSNHYQHPNEEHIAALRRSGAQILCTQLTMQCCSVRAFVENGVLPALKQIPQRSNRVDSDIGCAGTVVINLFNDAKLEPRRATEHALAVTDLCDKTGKSSHRPMCRESPPEGLLPVLS